jgi:hypothetical protein
MTKPIEEQYAKPIAILCQLGPREITISDVRKAFDAQYGDHHAKRLIEAGLLRKLGYDRYILTPVAAAWIAHILGKQRMQAPLMNP